ncbi:MAG TPA: efflux RND transporter permease subunit, partial [Acidobacteriota bacterium]|nr:efflux RND transporter permease subunit [Acidobacteriota bacterium]
VILFFFLRQIRPTLIAASSIPITLVITLFFMQHLNQTLNLMSLGGMAVAIGLVIDDAIVVVENIHRHLQRSLETGETKEAAVKNATTEILGAVSGSTFTTVVVFLPLGLVEGVVGQFFAAFSITLSVAVLVSLVLAFALIPLLAQRYLKEEKTQEGSHDRVMDALTSAYDRSVRRALAHPVLVILVTLVFVGLGALIYTRLGSGFLPSMDEGSFVLDYWMPSGTSLSESDRVLHEIEKLLNSTPEVDSISRRTGAELGLFATEQSRGDILVRLKKKRDRRGEEIMDDLREKIESTLPGIRVEFIQILQDLLGDLEGNPEPVEVKIFGEDPALLQERAVKIAEQIDKAPGIVDLYNGVQRVNPEIFIEVDPVRAQRAGLDPALVGKQMADALLGQVVTQFRQFDRLIGIRVRLSDKERFNYDLMRQFPLLNEKTGTVIPLASLATLREVNGQNEILRENQRQMIAITARISGASLGDVIPQIKKILDRTPLPLGYTYEIGGQYQSQQHSFRQLLLVLFIAVMLVFVLLVLQFREFLAALVILSAAPVSLIGAFLMLWITGTEFNVSSFMGLIMLIGLIVKNGIILVEYTFQLREQEKIPLHDALVRAGKVRLRPILMTTLATLFGLLPLALGLGAGSELQKPLALAVIGGLSLSMLVTLVFVPAMLLKLQRGLTTRDTEARR